MQKSTPRGSLVITAKQDGTPVWEAKWRFEGRQMKRRLGLAWIEAQTRSETPARLRLKHHAGTGWPDGTGWMKRRGLAPDGWVTEDEAVDLMAIVIEDHAEQMANPQADETVMFETVAAQWLKHGRDVLGWKATTARDYASMLHAEDRPRQKRGRTAGSRARVMGRWQGVAVADITTKDVDAWLTKLDELKIKDKRALSARSVNKHRAVLSMICAYAVEREHITENPVSKTAKRKEAPADELRAYSVEEVQSIARHAQDDTTAAIILTAGMTGLRMGELLALRWRDVDFGARRIRVVRSYSAGLGIVTPKSGKGRSVPLADQVSVVLDELSKRGHHTAKDALVFGNATGGLIDPSTLRARYVRARDAAITADAELLALRFHDLRHSFGTMCVSRGIDILTVQRWMGHRDIETTMLYLHYSENAQDADRLSLAFAGPVEQIAQVAA